MPIKDLDSADGIGRCKMIPTQILANALKLSAPHLSDKEIIEVTQSIISYDEVSVEFECMDAFDDFLTLSSPYQLDHHVIDMHHTRVLVVFNFCLADAYREAIDEWHQSKMNHYKTQEPSDTLEMWRSVDLNNKKTYINFVNAVDVNLLHKCLAEAFDAPQEQHRKIFEKMNLKNDDVLFYPSGLLNTIWWRFFHAVNSQM
jgi:hypothetical protein